MPDTKLFRISNNVVAEIQGSSAKVEKSLQNLFEKHLESFLGVRFLASEYSTGAAHGGRLDTLGIDENGSPVIIEYKRATNENVINQGLFYLDWLMDHRKEFQWMVMEKLGKDAADTVEWSGPRLLCIAGNFTQYDEHAIKQINRNIELIRYRYYDDMILLELVNATTASTTTSSTVGQPGTQKYKTIGQILEDANPELTDRYEALRAFLMALGDDVQLNTLAYYFAFRRIRNFACVELRTQKNDLLVYVKVDPDSVDLSGNQNLLRDVRKIGHYGTGDLEIAISNDDDFERAKPFLEQSYSNS